MVANVLVSEAAVWKIFAKYLGKQMLYSPFKVKLRKNSKNSYSLKRALHVSLPFGPRLTFVFVRGH